jgi:hypothetical protein
VPVGFGPQAERPSQPVEWRAGANFGRSVEAWGTESKKDFVRRQAGFPWGGRVEMENGGVFPIIVSRYEDLILEMGAFVARMLACHRPTPPQNFNAH